MFAAVRAFAYNLFSTERSLNCSVNVQIGSAAALAAWRRLGAA